MKPVIYISRVNHNRISPVKHAFNNTIFHLGIPLSEMDRLTHSSPLIGVNKHRVWSLFNRDYLNDSPEPIEEKLKVYLKKKGVRESFESIYLVTTPRIGPIGFNPVNFYLCQKGDDVAHTLVVEINNTFGEKHLYILSQEERQEAGGVYKWKCPKEFHVSPFNRVEGDYTISLQLKNTLTIGLEVRKEGEHFFSASMSCEPRELNLFNTLKTMFTLPFSVFLTTTHIGWQAGILYFKKRLPVHDKPEPLSPWTIRRDKPVLLQRLLTGKLLDKFQPN